MSEPTLDFTRDFAEVIGDPKARYMQDFHFYNSAGQYVGDAPEAHRVGAVKPQLSEKARKAQELVEAARRRADEESEEREALEAASRKLTTVGKSKGRGRVEPDVLADATRENAQALKAEAEAE